MANEEEQIPEEQPEQPEKPNNPLRVENAKIYLVNEELMARITEIKEGEVHIKGGGGEYVRNLTFSEFEFDTKCECEEIVSQKDAKFNDNGEFIGIKGTNPEQAKPAKQTPKPSPKPKESEMEIGWINEKTGKFSREKKRGYTQIRFEKVKKKVELEIDETQLQKLKEMGLV